jgi:hypothetical protein
MPKTTVHLKKHQFKPGGPSGNPKGRPPITKEQRELRNLTIERYREIINLALNGNIAQLKEFIEDPDTPAIQVGVATCLLKGIKNGDVSVVEHFAARLVGKIPDVLKIDSNANVNLRASAVREATDEEVRERIRKLKREV